MDKSLIRTTIVATSISLSWCLAPAKVIGQTPIRISFPTTSYCGGYGGPANLFVIELSRDQDLVIDPNGKPIRVKDPLGRVLPFMESEDAAIAKWRTLVAGDHYLDVKGGGLTFLTICAIDSPNKPFFPKDGA